MKSYQPNPTENTGIIPGPIRGILRKAFERAIITEAQTELISSLQKHQLAFSDVEDFIIIFFSPD